MVKRLGFISPRIDIHDVPRVRNAGVENNRYNSPADKKRDGGNTTAIVTTNTTTNATDSTAEVPVHHVAVDVKKFEYNISTQRGKLNDEDVILVDSEYEPGIEPDSTGIWKKFVVVTVANKTKIGILKVTDMRKAAKLGANVVGAIATEADLAKIMKHNMYLWKGYSEKQREYAIMYRYLRGPVYMGGGTVSEPLPLTLKFLPEWAEEDSWSPSTMIPVCQARAIKKHERMALHHPYFVIDKLSLFSWVTDKACKHWYPVEAPPVFEYRAANLSVITMRGAQVLDKKKGAERFKTIKKELEGPKYFSMPALEAARTKLVKPPFPS